MDKLEPCPFCGGEAECDSQQAFRALSSGKIGTRFTIYCTSCNADMGYCREDIESCNQEGAEQEIVAAWNTRAVPRATGDDGELVGRLRYTYEHGIFVAAEKGMLAGADEAADCIEALSVEMERLREALAEIEADCEADYPPSHGAIKYTARQALGAKP